MQDLFSEQRDAAFRRVQPLAVRMRPRTLDEYVGQEHFIGPGKLLRRLLEADRLASAILYGPPGTGKTTLAKLIANHTKAEFVTLHAAEAGVKDVRAVIEAARERLLSGRRTVLFLDEIHRFNRAQQDVMLKDVEDGVLILIGATTENPFFTVNSPLISRSQVFELHALTPEQIESILRRALADNERGLGRLEARCDDDALRFIAEKADGDARRALTALEVAVLSQHVAQPPSAGSGVAQPPSAGASAPPARSGVAQPPSAGSGAVQPPLPMTAARPPSAEPVAKPAQPAYRRNLPHINPTMRPVFVTFCTRDRWALPEIVRGPLLEHCLHDDGVKLQMHAAVVMPDHVHLVFTPAEDSSGDPYGLAEILNGIKGASAHTINRLLKRRGHVWQEESFDHVLRRDENVRDKCDYVCANPVRRGLVAREDEYPWIWREWVEGVRRAQPGAAVLQDSQPRAAVLQGSQPRAAVLHVTLAVATESLQRKAVAYDAGGDVHYDVASALIKSMRGSDPDAALYWLARMLEGGEDPRFIARRIAICASEDVGTADPRAVLLAAAAVQVTQAIGLPECQFALAQAAVYVALAPKSNAVTMAIGAAREDVRNGLTIPVPNHLRDASYPGAARLGRGQGYVYPHDDPSGVVPQDYLGMAKSYYNPTDRGDEGRLGQRLRELRAGRPKPPADGHTS